MGAASGMAAPADTTPNGKSLVLSKVDTDGDGTISLDEAKAAAAAKFAAVDTDKDGILDARELIGIIGPKALAKADSDKDHTLDKDEYMAYVARLFTAADQDHDGVLDVKELSTERGHALVQTLQY